MIWPMQTVAHLFRGLFLRAYQFGSSAGTSVLSFFSLNHDLDERKNEDQRCAYGIVLSLSQCKQNPEILLVEFRQFLRVFAVVLDALEMLSHPAHQCDCFDFCWKNSDSGVIGWNWEIENKVSISFRCAGDAIPEVAVLVANEFCSGVFYQCFYGDGHGSSGQSCRFSAAEQAHLFKNDIEA